MHSVRWQSARNGRQGDGEADFVLLHQQYGLLVLEVKGGSIEIDRGSWYSNNREGRHAIKDPFEQAMASKYALLNYLKASGFDTRKIGIGHAVAFPHISLGGASLGPAAPAEITWDGPALRTAARSIERTVTHWSLRSELSDSVSRRILDRLAPTFKVRRRLVDQLEDANAALIELTDRQIWAFSQIRGVRNALVVGGAGTGKTILAIERARQLAADGFRTLVVCYNDLLGRKLAQEFADTPNTRTSTFHSLCLSECQKAGMPADPSAGGPTWWEETAPELLISAVLKTGSAFDAIVVDEGQDFSRAWLDALDSYVLGADVPPLYVFADSHQDLYDRNWRAPTSWPRIELDLNCRSTRPIARRVSAIYGEEPTTNGTDGPLPRFYPLNVDKQGLRVVQDFVARLVAEEGLAPNRICVLADEPAIVTRLRELLAGDHPFVAFDEIGVVTETIARFKGLESDAVVLVLGGRSLNDPTWRAIAYTGLSRARAALFVFGTDAAKAAMKWEAAGP